MSTDPPSPCTARVVASRPIPHAACQNSNDSAYLQLERVLALQERILVLLADFDGQPSRPILAEFLAEIVALCGGQAGFVTGGNYDGHWKLISECTTPQSEQALNCNEEAAVESLGGSSHLQQIFATEPGILQPDPSLARALGLEEPFDEHACLCLPLIAPLGPKTPLPRVLLHIVVKQDWKPALPTLLDHIIRCGTYVFCIERNCRNLFRKVTISRAVHTALLTHIQGRVALEYAEAEGEDLYRHADVEKVEGRGSFVWANNAYQSVVCLEDPMEKMRALTPANPFATDVVVSLMDKDPVDMSYAFPLRRRPTSERTFTEIATLAAVFDSRGHRTAGLVILNDDLERKREASWIGEIKTVCEAMPQLVWTTHPDGTHEYFNSKWVEYTGCSLLDSYGEGWRDVMHPDDAERVGAIWGECLRTGTPYQVEYRIKRASDGMYRWFLGRALPLRDDSGKIKKWLGTSTEIHDQHVPMLHLREAQHSLKTCMANAAVLMWSVDREGQMTLAEGKLPCSDTSPVGKSVYDVFKDVPKICSAVSRLLAGAATSIEDEYCANGEWYRMQATSVIDHETNTVTGIACVSSDITARKQAEKRLEESELRAKHLFQSNIIGAIMLKPEARFPSADCECNDAWLQLLGLTREEYNDALVKGIRFAGDMENHDTLIQVAKGGYRNGERELIRIDGKRVPVLIGGGKIPHQSGHFVVFAIDLTDQKRTQNKVYETSQQLRKVICSLPTPALFFSVTLDTGIITVAEGQPLPPLFDVPETLSLRYFEDALQDPEVIHATREALGGVSSRQLVQRGDKWYDLVYGPVRDACGQVSGMVGFAVDVTDRRLMYEKLQQSIVEKGELMAAEAAAKEASRLKSEFLANMSHELRTPINGVVGMTELLLDTSLSEEQRDCAANIQRSADALLTVIQDILDFSKVEAGKLELEDTPFSLPQVLSDTAQMVSYNSERKGVRFVREPIVFLSSDGKRREGRVEDIRTVRGDSGRVRQVLANLLSNAVKFTNEGEVFIQIELQDGDSERQFDFSAHSPAASGSLNRGLIRSSTLSHALLATAPLSGGPHLPQLHSPLASSPQVSPAILYPHIKLRVQVFDTGVGISEATRARLFVPFQQGDSSTARRFGGTGLGLVISKKLIELMGGEIGIEGRTDTRGSRAWFSIPLRIWEGPEDFDKSSFPDKKAWIPTSTPTYLVEDFDTKKGMTLEVPSGPVSSHSMPASVASSPAGSAPSTPKLGRPMRILVAEDNDLNCRIVLRMLAKLGHQAEAVGNGAQAVAAIEKAFAKSPSYTISSASCSPRSSDLPPRVSVADSEGTMAETPEEKENPDDSFYDLILMDCQMPEVDGYEAATRVRTLLPPARDVPIVALTANAIKGDREKCLKAGMDDYLPKPFKQVDLEKVVTKWVGKKSTLVANSQESGFIVS